MWARVATGQVQPGKMDEFNKIYIETQKSVNQGTQGFQSARVLTDLSTNKAVAVVIWATEAEARATVTPINMDDVMARFGAVVEGPPIIEYYEVSVDY